MLRTSTININNKRIVLIVILTLFKEKETIYDLMMLFFRKIKIAFEILIYLFYKSNIKVILIPQNSIKNKKKLY